MTRGHPTIPRVKNIEIVKAILKVIERYEMKDKWIEDFMRYQL